MKKDFVSLLIILLICFSICSTNTTFKDGKNVNNKCASPSKLICDKFGKCKCLPFFNKNINVKGLNLKPSNGKKNCFPIGHSYVCKK